MVKSEGSKHYMEPTDNWIREHDRSHRDETDAPLAKAVDRFQNELHKSGRKMRNKWTNAQSRTVPHHIAEDTLREVIMKLRAASYRGAAPGGHDFLHLFKSMDKNHSGVLSYSQFARGVKKLCPVTVTELHAVFDAFDEDSSGTVDYVEFVKKLRGSTLVTEEELLAEDRPSKKQNRSPRNHNGQ